jgi:ABC-type spermidine/putrescine transport system permease subunit II
MNRVFWLLTVLLCVLLLGPILVVVVVSFSGDAYLAFPPHSLSLQWYQRFLGDGRWLDALFNSLVTAAMCCLVATATGFLAGYGFLRGRLAFRTTLMSLMLMPLIVPSIVTAISIYFLSVRLGLIGSRTWLAMAHAAVALPVVLILARSVLQGVDPALERAAMVHGCTRMGVLLRVVLPIASPGIISAGLFAFLASFDELVISLFVSGIRAETLPVRIWNSLTLELEPTIAAVSTLLIGVTVVVLLVDLGIRRWRSRYL